MKIGFIGQGFIGKNYADDLERRMYDVVRYSLEKPHVQNKDKIKDCDVVFVAVPTPTTPDGFDDSSLYGVLECVSKGTTVVIKSTMIPGTTNRIQEENPHLYVMHSPEFLREATAAHDAANPDRNIVGLPKDTKEYRKRADIVMGILPKAPFNKICTAREAEFIKYGGNNLLFFKVIFTNLLHDLSEKHDCSWDVLEEALGADPRLGNSHFSPVHEGGRGAGGHCFIKDYEALARMYEEELDDPHGVEVFNALRKKNVKLLRDSKKNLDLLEGVYGDLDKFN